MGKKSVHRWARFVASISIAALLLAAPRGDLSGMAWATGLWMQVAKLTASDGAAGDNLGLSVAIAGDLIVVGAWGHNSYRGAAYVFDKPDGGWANMSQVAKLTASDGSPLDGLGNSVAISPDGKTIVAGAYADDGAYMGSVYLFVKPEGGWVDMTETAKLTASDRDHYDTFGWSVGTSNDTVVVGAPGDNIGGNTDQGSAYLFVKPEGGWATMTETAKLTASDAAYGDEFGHSVAISDDTVVVGSIQMGALHGAAYVFVRPGSGWAGNPIEDARLAASDPGGLEDFGYSVAIDDDVIVVSPEYRYDTKPNAAYLFVEPPGDWVGNLTETARLTASDGAYDEGFGCSVSVHGETAAVGAMGSFHDPNDSKGSAYVFARPLSGWAGVVAEVAKLNASDAAKDDYLGASVAAAESVVVAGAYGGDIGSNGQQGSVYVFVGESPWHIFLPLVVRGSQPR